MSDNFCFAFTQFQSSIQLQIKYEPITMEPTRKKRRVLQTSKPQQPNCNGCLVLKQQLQQLEQAFSQKEKNYIFQIERLTNALKAYHDKRNKLEIVKNSEIAKLRGLIDNLQHHQQYNKSETIAIEHKNNKNIDNNNYNCSELSMTENSPVLSKIICHKKSMANNKSININSNKYTSNNNYDSRIINRTKRKRNTKINIDGTDRNIQYTIKQNNTIKNGNGSNCIAQNGKENINDSINNRNITQTQIDENSNCNIDINSNNDIYSVNNNSNDYICDGLFYGFEITPKKGQQQNKNKNTNNNTTINGGNNNYNYGDNYDKVDYVEVGIRCRKEREKLKGQKCNQCEMFYNAIGNDNKNAHKLCNHVSKHRYNHKVAHTPKGYWDVGFSVFDNINDESEQQGNHEFHGPVPPRGKLGFNRVTMMSVDTDTTQYQ